MSAARPSLSNEEKEQALHAVWAALPSDEHRTWLLDLMEMLVYGRPAG